MVVKFLNAFFLKSRRKKMENHGRGERLLMGKKSFMWGRIPSFPSPHVYATMKTMMCVFVLVDKRED